MSTDIDPSIPLEPEPQPVQQPLPPTKRPLDLLPPRLTNHARPAPIPDPADPDDDLPQSQPMTATHSNSSQNPDGDASAPYGTRSRNRGPRINYADDKELDMEIEATGRITKANARKAAAANAKDAPAPAAPAGNGFSAINSVSVPNGEVASGSVVTTAQAAPAPAPVPSKKRKQPGTSAAPSGTTTPFALGPRQSAHASHYVVSNMMSFKKSGARLNAKKQLVADDGTVLTADGETHSS